MQTVVPIRLGAACNNRCPFCALGHGSGEGANVLEQIAAAPAGASIALVGGEPTLHEGLMDWIRAAAGRGVEAISVQTNGRRLAVEGYAKALFEAGLTHVEVSLHGHESAVHDYHTGMPGSFRQSARGLLALRGLRVRVGVTTVVTRSNFRHLEAVAAVVQRVGASAWHVAAAQPLGAAAEQAARLVPKAAMVRPWLERALARCAAHHVQTQVSGGLGEGSGATFPFAGLGDYQEP